jgi:phospholipid/cholesterol/gamma-HCH transport system substrate-binding protein
MNEQRLRFRLGLFVVATIAALIILVAMFSAVPNFFVSVNRYFIVLDDATGISSGTPVRRSGVRIGQVSRVELNDETGEVRVTIEVPKRYKIYQNEEAVVTRTVLGDPAIDFVPRPEAPAKDGKAPEAAPPPPEPFPGSSEESQVPGAQPIPPGAELRGRTQRNISSSLAELNKTVENLNKLVAPVSRAISEFTVTAQNWGGVGERVNVLLATNQDKLVKTLDNVNDTFSRANEILGPENQKNLNATLKNVRNASDSLDSLTRSTDELLKSSQVTLKNVNNSLKQLDDVMVNLEKVTRPLAARSDNITRNLDESADRLNKLLGTFQDMFGNYGKTDSTVYRLLNDPGLYNNMNAIACSLARMMPQLDRILKDLEVFADKIARHPEALGVGGAVRPGSGLK